MTSIQRDIKTWDKWLEYSLLCNAPEEFKEACKRFHAKKMKELQKQTDKLNK